MSTIADTVTDSSTMLRRILRHSVRNPMTLITAFVAPLLMLLLLTYAFGGAIDTNGVKYIDYVVPGIILLGACYSASATSVAVSSDMNEGIIDRFRTMAIARSSVLIGQVVGSTLRTLFSTVLVVLVALALGFRPTANPVKWLAVIGIVTLLLFALSWVSIALGLASKTPEGASMATIGIVLLPYLSSAFVPTDTMPGWLQSFAANQPMTPLGETIRGLLMGTHIGDSGVLAVTWCVGIALVGYLWAQRVFDHKAPR
jgi:ABC-2 type transport system permease protein